MEPNHEPNPVTAPEPAELQASKLLAAAVAAAVITIAAAGCEGLPLQLVHKREVCVCKLCCARCCFCLRTRGVGLSRSPEAADGVAENLYPVLQSREGRLAAAS